MKTKFLYLCGFLTVFKPVYSQNQTVYGYVGETVKLQCPLLPPTNSPRTTWFGPYLPLPYFYNKDKNKELGQRFSVILNNSSKAYDLQITNLSSEVDKGNYSCSVNTNPVQQNFVGLKIFVDVYNVSLSPVDNPLNITENDERLVKCVVNSNADPVPTITWYLGSTNITSKARANTNFINITGNRNDTDKNLQCRATNSNKTPKTASTVLNVQFKPEVQSSTPSLNRVTEGNSALLECSLVAANPSTSIKWKWFRAENYNVVLYTESTYTISDVQRNMSGPYSCTASNSVGTSEAVTVNVDVEYRPDVISLTPNPYEVIEGQTATLCCKVTAANPDTNIIWEWFRTDSSSINALHNGANISFPNIQRDKSGSYICTASNSVGPSIAVTIKLEIFFPPAVISLSKKKTIIEGRDLSVPCQAKPGNPNSTTIYWTKVDNTGFRQNSSILQLNKINRSSSGTYRCTAENHYSNGEKGTHSQNMVVDVLYMPEILNSSRTIVNESEPATLIRQIFSNPLSNVYWYNGSELLETQLSARNATFHIQKTTCTDSKNFTLVASNSVQKNVTSLVELIVNCKPRSYKTNVTLGVTDTTGIDFSTVVIAYPEPLIDLVYENGSVPDQIMKNISRNAVNNFTIHISQAVVSKSDFGVYHLIVRNNFGEITVILNVIPRRKPNMPVNIEIVCDETRAKVQWKSSFNGGDPQLFTVIASSGQQSNNISDKGENVIHSTFVQHLQPSTMYVFYVSAQNSHGFISSEKISCTTLAESTDTLPIIVGSAAAGGLTLVVVLVVVVFLFRRYTNTEKQAGKSQRFENDLDGNESVDDDGLKDNILYVSADPRENEKHEAAVYAAVNKKDQMGNNNSNVYAEVKKNGIKDVKEGANYSDVKPNKGIFKKGGKVKKEKRQKRKQEVADVYENSDDIAMTANPDNVYSNTNHNNDSAKEQRGYKNKDGLLYVEVKFDTKTEERNPVIHGDDEKTDYATVEFPVPSSAHDRE